MNDNVVSLRGSSKPITEQSKGPNPALVEMLEDLLAKARTGEIDGLCGAYSWADGAADFFIEGDISLAQYGATMVVARLVGKLWDNDVETPQHGT